jgi:hypothetical protein
MAWAIVVIWGGVVNLAIVVAHWRGRISYQRARADLATAITRSLAARGGIVRDEHPDGAILDIVMPCLEGTQLPVAAQAGDEEC